MQRAALLEELARSIVKLRRPHPVRVGVDGVDGVGKTMLANELAESVRDRGRHVIRASVDSFHHPRSVRYQRGRSSPRGYYYDSFQNDAIRTCLLEPLGPGGSLRYRTGVFNHRTDAPSEEPIQVASERAVLIVDGIFLHRPELRELWDLTLFLDAPFECSVARMAQRDGGSCDPDATTNRRYVEGQRLYLRECRPRDTASVVIDNSDLADPRIMRGLGADD